MTRAQVIAAVNNLLESRAQKFASDTWLDLAIGEIVHRKRYWWRKKTLAFSTVIGSTVASSTYNLSAIDPYFEQAVNLYWQVATNSQQRLNYVENADDIQMALNSSQQGQPLNYLYAPGTTQKIIISPFSNSVYVIQVLYWAGFVSAASYTEAEPIPLIPVQFHYCVVLMMLKWAFLYLFGQNDPRYQAVVMELEGKDGQGGKLGDLDRLDFSVESVSEWRSTDSHLFSKSTGV